jgi:hypothetical protein
MITRNGRFSMYVFLFCAMLGVIPSGCSATPSIQSRATPLPTESPITTPTLQPTPTPSPLPTPLPTITPTPIASPAINPYGTVSHIASPDGKWTAVLDTRVSSLGLQRADGKTFSVFAPGSTAQTVSWSPDSQRLLVVRLNIYASQAQPAYVILGPVEIWQVRPTQSEKPTRLFQSPTDPRANPGDIDQIDFGQWSPNSRYILFWLGSTSRSIQADEATLYALDAETGKSTKLAEHALLNPRYQSWSPDSSVVGFTAGGNRSAQVNKWLDLFDVATRQVTTVVSKTEAIPGIVAWSPRGDWIAYAAVSALDSNSGEADYMGFDNPAILKRHVYLFNPKTHGHHRLNQVDAFQDAPAWSNDGAVLYYVQRDGNDMVLMAANPSTGEAQVIEGTRQPAPYAVGYYGQSNWDELLACRPDVVKAPIPQLTQTYADPTLGFALQYPTSWHVGKGFDWGYYCDDCTTFTPVANETIPPILSPFSCRVFISIEVFPRHGADLEVLLLHVRGWPGPAQSFSAPLNLFDQHSLTIDGKPALRLETMDGSGITNHVLIVLGSQSAFILHGRGDGRVFDAMAASLKLQ